MIRDIKTRSGAPVIHLKRAFLLCYDRYCFCRAPFVYEGGVTSDNYNLVVISLYVHSLCPILILLIIITPPVYLNNWPSAAPTNQLDLLVILALIKSLVNNERQKQPCSAALEHPRRPAIRER